jgi:putative ABC transport system permease protein
MVGLFGGVALLLASVGLYGTLSYMAGQRTMEIGIRMALGAGQGSIVRLIVAQGLRLAVVGALLGLGAAALGMRYVRSQLFGVEPTDAVTFGAVCCVLLAAAILACAIPARRAMRVDPVIALRQS